MLLGCFPNNAKHRQYAMYVEGGFLLGGVAILAVANTGADCDMSVGLGMPKNDCKSSASLISGLGLALIIGGLVGFMGTVATTADDKTPTKTTTATTPTKPTAPPVTPTPIAPSLTPPPPAPTPAPAP
jgi:hypothetical protein